mmetsp:Transcript_120228/g.268714  ORF Transcript_120228/g.268714 Transcript_120228/m.268714 type:complete len:436 (+) Transcript_120228:1-1308(+)
MAGHRGHLAGAWRCSVRRRLVPARMRADRSSTEIPAQVPTEFYGLLGLPLFTSDPKEIKSAHRRVVKLVHPDIIGPESGALQLIVTEAYETLSDEISRKSYDAMLKKTRPTLAQSSWSSLTPEGDVKGVFVDETKCTRCYQCVDSASSTFGIRDETREEKAYVMQQYGDNEEVIVAAILACPSRAIMVVAREDLTLIEYAMAKCAKLRKRAKDLKRGKELGATIIPEVEEEQLTVFEVYQDLMIEDLLAMDMEKALQENVDPLFDSKMAEELNEKAVAIAEAAAAVPVDVRDRLWPLAGDLRAQENLAAQTLGKSRAPGSSARPRGVTASEGLARAELKTVVFEYFDADGDGFLYDAELRKFAMKLGFDGGDQEWAQDYTMLCAEFGASEVEGFDIPRFSQLVDNEDAGCYLSDDELAQLLGQTGGLPRAGTSDS